MKQRIRLTESDLHRIVKESVKKVLKEGFRGYIGDKDGEQVYYGKKEPYPYREYVRKNGKLYTHYTPMNPSSTSSREWGSENEVDYDGRYDDDLVFKKFMGHEYDENRLNLEYKANSIINGIKNDIERKHRNAAHFEKEYMFVNALKGRLMHNELFDLYNGKINVSDLSDDELEFFVNHN